MGGVRLEYAPEILERLRLLSIDGLLALPRVGMAIGGLLTGSVQQGKVRVSDAIEIPCSHAIGPSFALTGAELARACDLAFGESKEQVVGWYCSRPRNELALDPQQAVLFAEICPEAWQIGLLLRPSTVEATRALICVRSTEIEYTYGRPMDLIEYTPPVRHAPAEMVEAEVLPPPPVQGSPNTSQLSLEPVFIASIATAPIAAAPVAIAPVATVMEAPRQVDEEEPVRPKRLFVLAALAGLALLFILYAYRWDFLPRPPLEVTVVEDSGQVTIRWNPEALQGIEEGSIALNDGGQLQTIPLDQRVLTSGWVRATRKSDRVTAKLTAGEVYGLGAWAAPLPPLPVVVAPPPEPAR